MGERRSGGGCGQEGLQCRESAADGDRCPISQENREQQRLRGRDGSSRAPGWAPGGRRRRRRRRGAAVGSSSGGRKGRAPGLSSGARFSHREGGRKRGKEQRERGESLGVSSPLHKQTGGLGRSGCTPRPLRKCWRVTERLLIFNIFVKAPGPGVMRMRQDVSFQLKQIKRGFTSLGRPRQSGKET